MNDAELLALVERVRRATPHRDVVELCDEIWRRVVNNPAVNTPLVNKPVNTDRKKAAREGMRTLRQRRADERERERLDKLHNPGGRP